MTLRIGISAAYCIVLLVAINWGEAPKFKDKDLFNEKNW